MKRRVVVTGMGLVVGDARDKESFARLCFAGDSIIKKCSVFDTQGLSTPFFGEAEGLGEEAALAEREKPRNGRFFELLKLSAQGLLSDAGVTREYIETLGRNCRMFFGTLIFSADAYDRHCRARREGKEAFDDSLASMNEFSGYARELLGIRGATTVISSSCASGTTAIGMAMDYIRSGLCECAVAGGVDCLAQHTAYGFHALKSMSSGVTNPFDAKRDGINIGECGALFLLESLEHAQARGAAIAGEISGYALSNDAYHITSPRPDGEGAYRTIKAALEDAGITAGEVGYINAHGTGTSANDSMEAKALERVFGESDRPVPLSSTKALLGHCMGASGAIELASVILALQNQKYIPMPRLEESIVTGKGLRIASESFPLEAMYALKNSFAFSGNSSALVVRRYGGEARE
jgi:3-oxoacyl-[acyl-carrier-protein] synthase II